MKFYDFLETEKSKATLVLIGLGENLPELDVKFDTIRLNHFKEIDDFDKVVGVEVQYVLIDREVFKSVDNEALLWLSTRVRYRGCDHTRSKIAVVERGSNYLYWL